MSYAYKVLGQSAPASITNTNVYTVGAGKQAIISTIVIANRSASGAAYRIAVRPGGATLSNLHYIAYDVAVAANDSTALTLGLTLGSGGIITVYASSANLSFGVFGTEIS
jgi:hypothetical protein